MKRILICVLALSACLSSQALTITTTSGVLLTSRWEGNQTGQGDIDAFIATYLGTSVELYKSDAAGDNNPQTESGTLAGSYSTTFNPETDPDDATITYGSGNYVGPTAFLLVKDGNQEPAWYLFNLTLLGWNGTDILSIENFWPNQGAISHVTLYGSSTTPGGGGNNAPDGGSTIALLGLALVGADCLRRKLVNS